MKSVFDRSFHYTPAASTDIRKLFRRVRSELKAQREAEAAKPKATVEPIKKARAAK